MESIVQKENNENLDPQDFRLLENFKSAERIRFLRRLRSESASGKLLLVDIVPKYSDGPKGLHIIEIRHQKSAFPEDIVYNDARESLSKDYLPSLVEWQTVGEKIGLIFKIETEKTLNATLLSDVIDAKTMETGQIISYIDQVAKLTRVWCSSQMEDREMTSPFEMLSEILSINNANNINSFRVISTSDDITTKPLLFFEGVDRILPNPLAYSLNSNLWDNDQTSTHNLVKFSAHVHGDLNCESILVYPGEHEKNIHRFIILRLASFAKKGPIFYDQACLELDILHRIIQINRKDDFVDWIEISKFITTAILPLDIPKGIKSLFTWELIKPIRSSINDFISLAPVTLKEYYQISFWMSLIAASLGMASKLSLTASDRIGFLMLGSLILEKVLHLLGYVLPEAMPMNINWKPTKDNFQPDYQKIDTTEPNPLSKQIIDLIRSGENISISSKIKTNSDSASIDNLVVIRKGVDPELIISRDQALSFAQKELSDIDDYFASIIVNRDFGPWNTRFVSLSAVAQEYKVPEEWMGNISIQFCTLIRQGEGPEQRIVRVPIEDITTAVTRYRQFVLLGEPGSGKTTVLQKLTLDSVRDNLLGSSEAIPLFVRLSAYRHDEKPINFLKSIWLQRLGGIKNLPSFEEMLRRGKISLFLDGLNEMSRANYREQIAAWKNFSIENPGVQMIFSCRTLDYAMPLEIQQIEITPLTNSQIQDFLTKYIGAKGEKLWALLITSPLISLARNPFILSVLAWIQAQSEEPLPLNRGELLNIFAHELLRREEAMVHPDWIESKLLFKIFTSLAWELQNLGEGTSISTENAIKKTIPSVIKQIDNDSHVSPLSVIRLGQSANIIEETMDGRIRFYHHLLQELFAAHGLTKRLETEDVDIESIWKIDWSSDMLNVTTDEWIPLSPPPPTGWEETTIVAAGMLSDASDFIKKIYKLNPVLASRCLVEGSPKVSSVVRESVIKALRECIENENINLRYRIAAGRGLSQLGDIRFQHTTQKGNNFIIPPMTKVPRGSYFIGSDQNDEDAFENEFPSHSINLNSYSIGIYLVTVAEYKCFVDANGYSDEKWWNTRNALAWLRGEEIQGGAIAGMLKNRKRLIDSGMPLDYWSKQYGWRPKTYDFWKDLTSIPEEEAHKKLREIYGGRTRKQPLYWQDSQYNSSNQPVVGITWFEARAYAAWLSYYSGRNFRLPTEAEWEVAVRGGTRNIYPWGQSAQKHLSNTVEGRVLTSTPVGVYPTDVSIFGLYDGAGNVREWTSSLDKSYPYDASDDRENEDAIGERVMRSGAWSRSFKVARCAFRDHFGPDFCDYNIGFRLATTD